VGDKPFYIVYKKLFNLFVSNLLKWQFFLDLYAGAAFLDNYADKLHTLWKCPAIVANP
jgi:hypothetical protein